MRTYVRMLFNSEGIDPKSIVAIMDEVGFKPSLGIHDFVYEWGKKHASIDDVFDLAARLHSRLKGINVSYEITTVK